jgi:uncharacterized protein YfaP (DUF2135 family)
LNTSFVFQAMGMAPIQADKPSRLVARAVRSEASEGCDSVRTKQMAYASSSMNTSNENDQANRAISNGKLHTLLRFHTRPINVVVFHGSDREYSFSGGFPA